MAYVVLFWILLYSSDSLSDQAEGKITFTKQEYDASSPRGFE